MRTFIVRGAVALVLASTAWAPGCTEVKRPPGERVAEAGKLRMALTSRSASGKLYRLRNAEFFVQNTSSGDSLFLSSEENLQSPIIERSLPASSYTVQLLGGWFVEQVDDLGRTATPVATSLLGSDLQFFDIQEDGETFVTYAFEVDGRRVEFGRGRLIVGIDVRERDGGGNPPPPPGLDPRRTLLETNPRALSSFSLQEAIASAQRNSGFVQDPVTLYQQIIDSYASAGQARIPGAAHCGDETTNGVPTLNGFPITCDRAEHGQFDNIGSWFPIAAANRVDLAPAGGAHCGQQRLVFANNSRGRIFAIFEAQIPNPNPSCGVAACRPIAEFWASLDEESSPEVRGRRIFEAFTSGAPELSAAGFGPFLTIENLSVGGGSIRTNNFDHFFWTLRQFKILSDPLGQTRAVPFPVQDAPHGPLWNDTSGFPVGARCRQSFLEALPGLLSDDPAELAFVVPGDCADAESPNDGFTQNYPSHLADGSGAFRALLEAALAGTGLTPEDAAARARFAGSCIGCHEESNGAFLGRGVSAPSSNGFVHVDEFSTEDCGDGTTCFRVSPALERVFLPRRLRALGDLLEGGGCGGVDGGGPGPADAGAPVTPPADAGAAAPPPTTVLTPDESIDDLVDEEEAARDRRGGETIGGQPAAVTH